MSEASEPELNSRTIESLFHEALELDGGQRDAFLERIKATDHALGVDLEKLLSSVAGGRGWLDEGPNAVELAGLDEGVPGTLNASTAKLLDRLVARPIESSRYADSSEVGRGGMGVVYKVWDPDLRRELAMKIAGGLSLHGETPTPTPVEAPLLTRFLREAQITGQLDHPGIVPVHELGVDAEGRVYFTMRLVRGRDLGSLIRENTDDSNWRTTRALDLLLKVCDAMAYAHDRGIIHRDLKPANIMVGEFGAVYVVDWGIARVLDHSETHDLRIRSEDSSPTDDSGGHTVVTMDGLVVGTPSYLSPEQAQGKVSELSARSDVYALGAILYHLLAGRAPYSDEGKSHSPWETLRRVQEGPPVSLGQLNPAPPAELVAICEKAMAHQADARYADTGELAEDLRNYLEGRVVRAYQVGALAEIRKWVRRNRAIAASMIVVLASIIGGLGSIGYVNSVHASELGVEKQAAEDVLFFLKNMIESANPSRGFGSQVTVREMMADAAKNLETQFEGEPELRSNLERTLSQTYFSIGMQDQAELLLQRAINSRRRAIPEGDWKLAFWMMNLGDAAGSRGFKGPTNASKAAELLQEAIAISERVSLEDPARRTIAELMKAVLAQAERIRDGLVEAEELPEYVVSGFAAVWKQDAGVTRERLTVLMAEIEEAWYSEGSVASYTIVRRELDPYMGNFLIRNQTAPGLERLADWAEASRRIGMASALRSAAVEFVRTERGFGAHTLWMFWKRYVRLLIRTEQWELALAEAESCAAFGDERYPKDLSNRLEAHEALLAAMGGAGVQAGLDEALQVRLELARGAHAEGEEPPILGLLELARHRLLEDPAGAEALLLEAWEFLESDSEIEVILRQACAGDLMKLYESRGEPVKADLYRDWASPVEPQDE